jgi:hypothetical protein
VENNYNDFTVVKFQKLQIFEKNPQTFGQRGKKRRVFTLGFFSTLAVSEKLLSRLVIKGFTCGLENFFKIMELVRMHEGLV